MDRRAPRSWLLHPASLRRQLTSTRRPRRPRRRIRRERRKPKARSATKSLPAGEDIAAAGRVNLDYHLVIDGLFYSVPHRLVHHEVEARLTPTTVELLHNRKTVALLAPGCEVDEANETTMIAFIPPLTITFGRFEAHFECPTLCQVREHTSKCAKRRQRAARVAIELAKIVFIPPLSIIASLERLDHAELSVRSNGSSVVHDADEHVVLLRGGVSGLNLRPTCVRGEGAIARGGAFSTYSSMQVLR